MYACIHAYMFINPVRPSMLAGSFLVAALGRRDEALVMVGRGVDGGDGGSWSCSATLATYQQMLIGTGRQEIAIKKTISLKQSLNNWVRSWQATSSDWLNLATLIPELSFCMNTLWFQGGCCVPSCGNYLCFIIIGTLHPPPVNKA